MPRPSMDTLYKPGENNRVSETVFSTQIDDLYYLPNSKFNDDRGFFAELTRIPELDEVRGKDFVIKQINLANSTQNVIRGFHAEDWSKLVNVITGECFSVIVDTRESSKTFGKTEAFLLGDTQRSLPGSLFLPAGVANSVCVLKGPVNYLYCVDALYKDRNPEGDVAISLFDEDINVDWPISRQELIYSDRDTKSQTMRERFPNTLTNLN